MTAFTYRAVDAAGRAQKGVVEAASAAGARRLLRERALLPVAVEASTATPRLPWRRRVGQRTLATATRQLATLIGSDIRVEDALRLAADQAETTRMRSLLLDLRGAILDGRSFAGALATRADAFPEYYRASIAAGEQSGTLADVLAHLADFVETRSQAQNKAQLALLYPALLAVVSLGMVVMLMVYVVPSIVRVFQQHGADLPFLTRALIGLSGFVRSFGWAVVALLVLGGTAFRRWIAAPANRLAVDRILATRPPFARFSRQVSAARFAGTLAQLVQSASTSGTALCTSWASVPAKRAAETWRLKRAKGGRVARMRSTASRLAGAAIQRRNAVPPRTSKATTAQPKLRTKPLSPIRARVRKGRSAPCCWKTRTMLGTT